MEMEGRMVDEEEVSERREPESDDGTELDVTESDIGAVAARPEICVDGREGSGSRRKCESLPSYQLINGSYW
jgi:hypothetical protein